MPPNVNIARDQMGKTVKQWFVDHSAAGLRDMYIVAPRVGQAKKKKLGGAENIAREFSVEIYIHIDRVSILQVHVVLDHIFTALLDQMQKRVKYPEELQKVRPSKRKQINSPESSPGSSIAKRSRREDHPPCHYICDRSFLPPA